MNQNNNIHLILKKISEVKFFFNSEFDWDSFDVNKLRIDLSFELKPNMETDILGFKINVRYMISDEELLLLELGILMNIHISNIKLFFDENEKILSRNLAANIINLGVGTLRGVLSTKVRGTTLENYPLPFISLSKIEQMINNTSNDSKKD